MNDRRLLLAGNYLVDWHETAMRRGLEKAGWKVDAFRWLDYVGLERLLDRVQNKLMAGPGLRRLNRDLLVRAREGDYDVVWINRGTHVYARTVSALRNHSQLLVSYNNDDAFGAYGRSLLWVHFTRAIPFYDVSFVYRDKNADDLRRHGARQTVPLRSYYVPELHFPEPRSEPEFQSDILFIGHYEDDGRSRVVQALLETGLRVRVIGPFWNEKMGPGLRRHLGRISTGVFGAEYRYLLSSAKVCLAFFSAQNSDTYTRRVFEICACGSALLAPRTDAMKSFFVEGLEAVYFSSPAEAVAAARRLLDDPELRGRLAAGGRLRCVSSGYDSYSRMASISDVLLTRMKDAIR